MNLSLDDLKNVWFGFTNPQHWQNMMNEFHGAGNALTNAKDRMANNLGITNTGGATNSAPAPTLGEVWQKLNGMLSTQSQPANNSGSSR